ncbi:putative Ig domain-containing protein [Streptomyces lunaelactis]|uniref:alkaline phosphatase family protein n=1 Tax=Streptomyces lunaelactis TaxID=1535768 RepID=UPI0015854C93|nr:alkaline phosphatase family protein [Streptomyces lunaelactis]NUL04814.1 putative Ig domain-containing protein [Streptomyces lunaelactis]
MKPPALPSRRAHSTSTGRRRTAAGGIFSTLCLVATLGAADSHAAAPRAAAALPSYDHVVVVVFENKQYGEIMGSSNAPYINQLAAAGASLTSMKALTHPSQPNYFNLFSGATQGITGDGCYTPQSMSAANLGQELAAAGKTFATYNEDLPSEGSTACTNGQYAQKHNPWFAFKNVPLNTGKTWAQFPKGDFAQLPHLSFVVPNQCNDMHSCPVGTGDTWVRNSLDGYAQWAKANNSLLVLTWDEDNYLGSNRIATVFSGAKVKQGQFSSAYNHYNLLRTFEDLFGTTHAGNAASATPITEVFGDGTTPPEGDLKVTSPGAQNCAFNRSCTVQITATGGKAPLKYSASGLPFGLSIDAATGRISGRPWQVGPLQITATATDSAGVSAGATFPLTVNWF